MANLVHKGDLPNGLRLEGDIAVDTETMGLNHFRDRLCLVQLTDGKGDAHIVQIDRHSYKAPNLQAVLTDPKRTKIFHFARFDVAVIQKFMGFWVGPIYCTKIASKLARTYTDSHGLKELCRELLSIQISKQQQSSDWGAETLTPEQIDYAASDVLHLHKIRDILEGMLKREGRQDLAAQCFQFMQTRAALDLAGWPEHDIFSHQSA